MRIDRLDIHHLRLPLREPWRTSAGIIDAVETVYLHGRAGDAEAWVESCPHGLPLYLPDTAATCALLIEQLFAPLVVGRQLDDAAAVNDLLTPYRGNSFAKAAVEMLWWSLEAVRREQPLHLLLGGDERPVRLGEAVGVSPPMSGVLDRIGAALAAGFSRIKLKMAPGWDLKMLREVRGAFPAAPLQVDCNGAYTLADIPLFEAIDELGLSLIEQPLHWRDLADHAILQRRLRTPICLDESITCRRDAEAAIRLGACRAICLKPGRVGGLQECLAIRDLCVAGGVDLWVGSMLESEVGAAINLALSTLPGVTLPSANLLSRRYYDFVMAEPELEMSSPGSILPARQPCLGRAVDPKRLQELTLATRRVGG